MKRASLVLAVLACAAQMLPGSAAAQTNCDSDTYSFVVYSDDYMTGPWSGFDLQILKKMYGLDPNIRMILAAGDQEPTSDAREAIDADMAGHLNCGEPEYPFFPAMGNHNYDEDTSMAWFRTTYANNWANAPETSRLAKQLPSISNFRRGPTQVLTPSGLRAVWDGTIYSFDFKNAHFVILNDFEQAGAPQPDINYGVWDVNGPNVSDPTNSQLDWLADDLARTDKPLKFVVSHVGNVAAWYAMDNSMTPQCDMWSEHQTYTQDDPNSPFHTKELAAVLARFPGVVSFRGHDHCPSRHIVDANNLKVFERSYWDAYRDTQRPFGDTSLWQNLMGPGRFWQVDDGSAYNDAGFFTLTKVTPFTVTIETYRWNTTNGPLILWDSFSIPVPNAPADTDPPSVPTNVGGTALSPSQIRVTWNASTDNVGVTAYTISRDGQQVGTASTTFFVDTGLSPSTTYNYTITASDKAGNTSAPSVPGAITTMAPDNVPPTVSMTAPADGATVSGTVTVSAAAADDVKLGGVQLLLDGAPLGAEIATAPFSASWSTRSGTNGPHSLSAVARDVAGNTTNAVPVGVAVNNDITPPVFSAITSTMGTSNAVISWVTDEPSDTQVQWGTTTAYGSQTTLNKTLVLTHSATITNLKVGTVYHYRVRSADALGNVGFSDDQTALIPDVTPPTTPGSFTATAASPIKINLAWGASTDNVKVSEYRVYRNSQLITTTTSRSYADNNLQPNTTYTYGVEAVDSSGNVSGRASVNGTTQADTTLPSVSISAPASGATVSGTSVTITATASDNVAVAGVQFQIDGVNVGAEVTAAPYTITWNSTTVTNATHSVTAVARDTSGNTKISSGRNIKVRN